MTFWGGQCTPCCFSVVLRSVHRQTFETEIRLDTRQWCADGLDCHLKKLENTCCYSHYSLSFLKRFSRECDICLLSYWLMREAKRVKSCGKKTWRSKSWPAAQCCLYLRVIGRCSFWPLGARSTSRLLPFLLDLEYIRQWQKGSLHRWWHLVATCNVGSLFKKYRMVD